jgi:ABC-type polysaccharide/polyol phosphate export permease
MQRVGAVVYRDTLIRLTSLTWLFFDMAVPLLYLLLFGVGFDTAVSLGRMHGGAAMAYNEFFLAGVLAMSSFGSAVNQSYGFFHDRDTGIFFEFLTYPLTRGEYLLGKVLFQCIMSVVQASLTIAAGVFLLDIPVKAGSLPLLFPFIIAGIAGWFFAMAIMAFLIRKNDTYNTFSNGAYFVLMFVSSLFYPLDTLPTWLRTAAVANPLTWQTDVIRFLTIGYGDAAFVSIEAAGFIMFSIVMFFAAMRALRYAV